MVMQSVANAHVRTELCCKSRNTGLDITQSKEVFRENHEWVLSIIVNKVFEQSGIRGIIVNSHISEVFRKKIFCFQKAVKKASNRGN